MGENHQSRTSLSDPTELAQRRGRVFESHVESLNRWVESLRSRLPLGSEVPWFDHFQKRTWSGLSSLSVAMDPDRPSSSRTKELASSVCDEGLARQLMHVVKAEAALARTGLADVLDSYRDQMELLGLEAPPAPPALAELSVGAQFSDTIGAAKSRLGRLRR